MQEAAAASAELENQLAAEPEEVTAIPVSDPSITEMVETESQEILTGGVCPVVYFNQGDRQWAELRYGTDYIGRYGCGPTAMAMVVDSLTDEETDPAQMAQFAVDHGYWARSHGSYLSIVEGVCASYGLEAHAISALTEEAVVEELSNGHILVALMGPGHFTKSGHFILLRGVTLSGSILVADPNSVDRSLTEWDASTILDELSGSTSNGAPLWVVTAPAG
jgi:predicted double-glycine peptidase